MIIDALLRFSIARRWLIIFNPVGSRFGRVELPAFTHRCGAGYYQRTGANQHRSARFYALK